MNASEEQPTLVPAYYGRQPEHIQFLPTHPAFGGVVEQIACDDFCKQEGIIWSTTPVIRESVKQCWLDPKRGQGVGACNNNIAYHLFQKHHNVAICQMDKRLGKGLVALAPIKQGEYICCYTGFLHAMTDFTQTHFQAYGYECRHPGLFKNWFARNVGTPMLNAELYRNYSTYMQHGMLSNDPRLLAIPKEYRDKVNAANICVAPTVHLGFPVLIVAAMRDIDPGEFLQYDYGNYWHHQQQSGMGDGTFLLHDNLGRVIGSMNLAGEFTLDPDYQLDDTPNASRGGEEIEDVIRQIDAKVDYTENFAINGVNSISSVIMSNKILLQSKYIPLLEKFADICEEREVLKYHSQCLDLVEGEMFSHAELFYIKMELRVYLSQMARYYAAYFEKRGDHSVQLNIAGLEHIKPLHLGKSELNELKARLWQKTNVKWSVNADKQLVFIAGEEQQLKQVRSRFQHHTIFAQSLAKRQGQWYLVYETNALNLDSVNRLDEKSNGY